MTFPLTPLDLRIEFAFGADLTAPLTWTWTDLSDRLISQGIALTRGRSDEASETQPASVHFVLSNLDGALTPLDPTATYYPNVKRGVPVRMTLPEAETALNIPGVAGAYASTPDHASLDITGDIDIRVRVQPDQWATIRTDITLDNYQIMVAKADDDERSYQLGISEIGRPTGIWSPDGTFVNEEITTSSRVIASLKPMWYGMTIDVDDGASGHVVTYYRYDGAGSPPADITTWTQITFFQRSGTTSIFASTSPLEIGSSDLGTETDFRGRIFAAEIRDGINGTLVADPDFSAQTPGATSFNDSTGKTWTINGAAEISTRDIRLVGTVDDITPFWPHGDNEANGTKPSEARVAFTVSGILRRLSQGEKPLGSTLYRHITSRRYLSRLLGYWPCEDGDRAVALASGIPDTTTTMSINDGIDTASDDSLVSSAPLPTIQEGETGTFTASVPFSDGTDWDFSMFFKIPEMPLFTSRAQLIELRTTGSAEKWIFEISNDDTRFRILAPGGSPLVDQTTGSADYSDKWMILRISGEEVFGTIDWRWDLIDVDVGTFGGVGGSFSGTGGPVNTVLNSTVGPTGGLTFGHIAVTERGVGTSWLAGADTAWAGESAARRFWRLCVEENIPVEIIGDQFVNSSSRGDLSLSEAMGPQRRNTLLDLLRECANLDMGVMIERRRAPGLIYRTRKSIEAQSVVALPIDASIDGELDHPFTPTLDDQRLQNDITVTTVGGSSARATDQTSIDAEGLYETSIDVVGVGGLDIQAAIIAAQTGLSSAIANQNANQANRRLYISTWPTMRYPTISMELGTANHLIPTYQVVELGDRITVTNLPEQHPAGTVELILEQIVDQLTLASWRPQLTCSPGGPWLTPYDPGPPGGGAGLVNFWNVYDVDPSSSPVRFLSAIGHSTPGTPITRAELDGILDTWVAGTGGTTHNVTSLATWNTAMANVVPGDLVRVTSDPGAILQARGDKYSISGANMTSSPSGGTASLPIILTCANGVTVDPGNLSNNNPALAVNNVDHVWPIGFNVTGSQFGIRFQNVDGTPTAPVYVAWCDINATGHAGLTFAGWFQAITDSGGTPPAGAGNEWGFSSYIVAEANTVTDPGELADQFGECVYLGRGSSDDGYKARAHHIWVRYNELVGCTADYVDTKPGCHHIYIQGNLMYGGGFNSGSAMQTLYAYSAVATRPAWYDFDPEVFIIFNRIYDGNLTKVIGGSSNYVCQASFAGIRMAFNECWGFSSGGVGIRLRTEIAKTESRSSDNEQWIIVNNLFWLGQGLANVGDNAFSPFDSGWIDSRNNLGETSTTDVEFNGSGSDFVGTVPALSTADPADDNSQGPGSAFDMDSGSSLVMTGTSIAALDLYVNGLDISQRVVPGSPNPGPFQPS